MKPRHDETWPGVAWHARSRHGSARRGMARPLLTVRRAVLVSAWLLLTLYAMWALVWTWAPAQAGEPRYVDPASIVCEEDGAPGILTVDGTCMTAARYDAIFSYEALAATPSQTDPSVSVAEAYGIKPDVKASERPREFAGESLPTFVEVLWLLRDGCPC